MSAGIACVSFWPLTSSPYVTARLVAACVTLPSRDGERAAVDLPLRGGEVNEQGSRAAAAALRSCGAMRRRRAAAEGAHVVGREVGIRHHQLNRADRNAQFLRDRLRQRGADVLARPPPCRYRPSRRRSRRCAARRRYSAACHPGRPASAAARFLRVRIRQRDKHQQARAQKRNRSRRETA